MIVKPRFKIHICNLCLGCVNNAMIMHSGRESNVRAIFELLQQCGINSQESACMYLVKKPW